MLNRVILIGRLCADPDLRQTQNGTAVCRIRLAINRRFKNQQTGEYEADFVNVTCWKQTAEFVSRYFQKGSMAVVEGELRNNNYTDQNGVKHYSMEVLAEHVTFGESKSAAQSQQNAPQQPSSNLQQNNRTAPPMAYTAAQNAPQQVHTYQQDVQQPQQAAMLGDLGDFEEILSDGEVPF